MASGGEQITGAAVEALLGVVTLDAEASEGDEAVARLAEAVRAAADAPGVAVWIQDHRLDRGRLVASAGAVGGGLGGRRGGRRRRAPRRGRGGGPGRRATCPPRSRRPACPHALVVPVADASRGLVIVAGEGPLDDDPLRRAAVAAGAARIGAVLDAVRMRDNLERAMAQILATDERMLGRMGLDIHDGPTQQLSVALLEVQLLEADIADAADQGLPTPDSLRPALGRIYETVGGALHEMRELIGHLRPAQFEDRTLKDILGDALVAFEARADCEVESEFDGRVPGQRGVDHPADHLLPDPPGDPQQRPPPRPGAARARARSARTSAAPRWRCGTTAEGFDPEAVQRRKPGMPLARFGLHGMRDRAQILGGTFEAVSTPGDGRHDPRVPAAVGGPRPGGGRRCGLTGASW